MCFCLFVDLEGIKEKSIKIRFRYWEFCDVRVKNKFDKNINLSVVFKFCWNYLINLVFVVLSVFLFYSIEEGDLLNFLDDGKFKVCERSGFV